MKKQTFEKGDRVFDVFWGWGKVSKIERNQLYCIRVDFRDSGLYDIGYLADGRYNVETKIPRLSFTEYDLINGGFSQERPINYDDYIGKWGKFWDKDNPTNVSIDCLNDVDNDEEGVLKFIPYTVYKHHDCFEPLTDEQIKVLGL